MRGCSGGTGGSAVRFKLSGDDWARCRETASSSGQTRLLGGVLSALHRLLGTPLPDLTGGSQAETSLLTRGDRLLTETDLDGREPLTQFFHIKGLTARLRFVWGMALPSKHFMRLQYPTTHAPLPLLYCLRISSLLALTAMMMARILRLRMIDTVRAVSGTSRR